jgi:glycosyltransferase involved in cell wall biosynthesis
VSESQTRPQPRRFRTLFESAAALFGDDTASARPVDLNRPRRVLLIQTQAENAGAQEISRLLGAGLTARGYQVHHLFFYRKSASFDEPPNTIYCARSRPAAPLSFLRLVWTLGSHIHRLRPDTVLTFQHYGNAIGGGISRLVSPAPVIANQVTARWTVPRWLRLVDAVMGTLGFFRTITVNSHDTAREYAGLPASYRARIHHVAHGFAQKSTMLSKGAARRAFDLPRNAILLGSAARLHRGKRLDAAIRLLKDRPRWHLAIAGQGPQQAELKALAETLGVASRVHFIGEISPERIGDFLAALDVFVFPSEAETFGLAAVEAANAGIPAVVNDLPVLREVLSYQGRPAALFVDASNHDKLSDAVARVLDDPALRETLRQNGLGLRARYSVEAMVEEYIRIIEAAEGAGLVRQAGMT